MQPVQEFREAMGRRTTWEKAKDEDEERAEASNVLLVDLLQCKRGAVVVLLPTAMIFAHRR